MFWIFGALTDIVTLGALVDKKWGSRGWGGSWRTSRKTRMRNYNNSMNSMKSIKRTPSMIPTAKDKYIRDAKDATRYAWRNYNL